jgi:uncharacterized protein (TIGR02421 family)
VVARPAFAAPLQLPPLAAVRRFELRLRGLCMATRILPALTAENAASERQRMTHQLERGVMPVPRWRLAPQRVSSAAFRLVDGLRSEARTLAGSTLYLAKLDELELDLLLMDALGKPRLVRPLCARRYGTGATLAPTGAGPRPLAHCARVILDRLHCESEPRELAAMGEGETLGAFVQQLADAVGLEVSVRLEPSLSAGAATGERTVFIAARRFGRVEARRLAVHEVLGHLLVAANARVQPLQLLSFGTAGSFIDQEGLALHMEELSGVLDANRLRTLAGRVLAADCMHAGASFAETAGKLHRDERFPAPEAIAIAERAYRGGGVARDVGYLLGWLRVSHALATGDASLDELRLGRVSLDALPVLRVLRGEGYVRDPVFRPALPNFARNFFSASSGTTPLTSPPSDAASLIKLELTK